jgi:hypothetical protein
MKETFAVLNQMVTDGVTVRVAQAEHLVAMMLMVGRLKDFARIQIFPAQEAINSEVLEDMLRRHSLNEKWNDFRNRFLS